MSQSEMKSEHSLHSMADRLRAEHEREVQQLRSQPSVCQASLAAVTAERDGWIESAKQFSDGLEFYRGIVYRIGAMFGDAAKTSDDGSVQQDVLTLKVPECVEKLTADRDRLTEIVDELDNSKLRIYFSPLRIEDEAKALYVAINAAVEAAEKARCDRG